MNHTIQEFDTDAQNQSDTSARFQVSLRDGSQLFRSGPPGDHLDDWDDVPTPDVPTDPRERLIAVAENLLRHSLRHENHHERVRKAMAEWAAGIDGTDEDPGYYLQVTRRITPDERNFSKIAGEPDEKERKAETVLAFARDTYGQRAVDDCKAAGVRAARSLWKSAAEDANERAAVEAFRSDPPAEINGWVRFQSDKPDVVMAYRADCLGTPSVAAVYETGDGHDAHESTLEEWTEADQAAESKVNRHFVRLTGDTSAFGCLRSHLRTMDATPLEVDQ